MKKALAFVMALITMLALFGCAPQGKETNAAKEKAVALADEFYDMFATMSKPALSGYVIAHATPTIDKVQYADGAYKINGSVAGVYTHDKKGEAWEARFSVTLKSNGDGTFEVIEPDYGSDKLLEKMQPGEQDKTESEAAAKRSPMDILRDQLTQKGTKTKFGDYELSKGNDSLMFRIVTEESRGLDANGNIEEKSSQGVEFEYVFVLDGVRHTYDITVAKDHEEYVLYYNTEDAMGGAGLATGAIIAKEYPSSSCYKITANLESQESAFVSLIPNATPILLAGIDTILKDNDIPVTVADFGFVSK